MESTGLSEKFTQLHTYLSERVIGQAHLIRQMIVGLVADGHLLVEGAPGLAKTRAIQSLASAVEADFHRIQFTPDLLPADLTGSDIYSQADGGFKFAAGPIFHKLILADEVNRAPAKVQAAMLQAMAEKSVTVGSKSYELPSLFMVMATQNPLEQEGTYPLPEAQLDRFMLHILVDYPAKEASKKILATARQEAKQAFAGQPTSTTAILQEADIFAARQEVMEINLSDVVEDYLLEIVETTRDPARYDQSLQQYISVGSSPRGAISIERCARVEAWLNQRDYVTPEDVRAVVPDCLRHRIILDYLADADGTTSEQIVQKILHLVPSP